MPSRVRYRKKWETEFPRSSSGRAAFGRVGDKLVNETTIELKRTGLTNDPPAREYLRELGHAPTDRGVRVFTTAGRAPFVEWGTYAREADAPMRTAARRLGRFKER